MGGVGCALVTMFGMVDGQRLVRLNHGLRVLPRWKSNTVFNIEDEIHSQRGYLPCIRSRHLNGFSHRDKDEA